jgi:hypothetical protein
MNFEDKITCSVREALECTSLGKTRFYELMNDGAIESVKIGSKRLVKVKSLLQLLGEKSPPKLTPLLTTCRPTVANGDD